MKHLRHCSFIAIFCFFSVNLFAQKEITAVTRSNPYHKMIHILPLPLFVGGLEMAFEKPTSNKESFLVQVGYYSSQSANPLNIKEDGYSNMNGLKVEMQYRFYRKSNNYKKNFWISPFINFKTLSAEFESTTTFNSGPPLYNITYLETKENRAASTLSFGYMLGLRRAMFDNVYFDMSFGGAMFIPVAGDNHEELHIPVMNPYMKGIQFKGNIGFCIAL